MNARYYLPGIGRFVSADTIVPNPVDPQSFNRYSYSYNNPLKYVDPTGHCAGSPNGVGNSLDESMCWAAVHTIANGWNDYWAGVYGDTDTLYELAAQEYLDTAYWQGQLLSYYNSDYFQANQPAASSASYAPFPMEAFGDVAWALGQLELGGDTYNELVKLAGDNGRVLPFQFGSALVIVSAGLEGGAAGHTPVRIVYDMGAAFAFDIVVDSVAGIAAVGAGAVGSAVAGPAGGLPAGAITYVALQLVAREPVNQATEALWVSLTTPIPQTQVIPPSPVPTPPPPVNSETPVPW